MRLATLVFVVILNLSSAVLHNVMVVEGDEANEIGTIGQGEGRKVEILAQDSIRVIFTLGQKREDWLGTEQWSGDTDTIKIDDKTKIFDIDICID